MILQLEIDDPIVLEKQLADLHEAILYIGRGFPHASHAFEDLKIDFLTELNSKIFEARTKNDISGCVNVNAFCPACPLHDADTLKSNKKVLLKVE